MKTVTYDTAKANLQHLISNTLTNQEETIIVTDKGSVVLIDKQNWEGIVETMRLFRDKKSLNALVEGHQIRADNKKPKGKNIKEVFNDI